jgi:hypothetical protein
MAFCWAVCAVCLLCCCSGKVVCVQLSCAVRRGAPGSGTLQLFWLVCAAAQGCVVVLLIKAFSLSVCLDSCC